MGQRLALQQLLETLEAQKVYFQAPSEDRMVYPCILYSLDNEDITHADNTLYSRTLRYQVTVIDRSPDSDIPAKIANLPLCAFQRFFVTDGLNHFVYNLYF